MPATQGVAGQRCNVGRIDVGHHLGDALLARLGWRTVGGQAELSAQGGLHTGPIQHFALDGARPHRLFTQQLDAQPVALFASYMTDGAEDFLRLTARTAARVVRRRRCRSKNSAIRVASISSAHGPQNPLPDPKCSGKQGATWASPSGSSPRKP